MASIYILGAGAMGSLWAANLHLALQTSKQHTVQFLTTRTSSLQNINYLIESPFLKASQEKICSEFEIELPIIHKEQLAVASEDQPHIILICTKSYHALNAALLLKPFINKHSYLVLFQNGLGSQHDIIEAFPTIPVFAAVSTEGVNRQEDGKLIHAGKGLTHIGPLNEAAKKHRIFEHCFTALTNHHLETVATEHIWKALWEKLAINCAINPFTAILNCSNGKIKDSALFRENWPTLKLELATMLNTAGFPVDEHELENRIFKVIYDTQTNISSMLQDTRAKRKTEIKDINGFAAQYLQNKGLRHTVNSMLYQKLSKPELA